jgi:hypothetical protein
VAGLRLQVSRARQASVAFSNTETNIKVFSARPIPLAAPISVRIAFSIAIPRGTTFAIPITLSYAKNQVPGKATGSSRARKPEVVALRSQEPIPTFQNRGRYIRPSRARIR